MTEPAETENKVEVRSPRSKVPRPDWRGEELGGEESGALVGCVVCKCDAGGGGAVLRELLPLDLGLMIGWGSMLLLLIELLRRGAGGPCLCPLADPADPSG